MASDALYHIEGPSQFITISSNTVGHKVKKYEETSNVFFNQGVP
jgi:sarcosine oxidase delta subunit